MSIEKPVSEVDLSGYSLPGRLAIRVLRVVFYTVFWLWAVVWWVCRFVFVIVAVSLSTLLGILILNYFYYSPFPFWKAF